MVSIVMLTYNHEKYIAKAIESVLSQQTNFNYELIIGDDNSSDQTRAIAETFALNHEGIVKLIIPEKEKRIYINGKPTGRYNLINCFQNASGKYIAFCDGDDYWTSTHKLQQQVDLLESQNLAGSFHLATINNLTTGAKTLNYGKAMPQTVIQQDIYTYGNHIPTVSVIFKKEALPEVYPQWFFTTPYGDMVLYHIILKNNTAFKRIDEHWAVYNLSGTGVFSSTTKKKQSINELQSFMFPISRADAIGYLFTATYFRKLAFQNFFSFVKMLLGKR